MRMAEVLRRAVLGVAVAVVGTTVAAYDGIVEKKTFTLASYTTVGGKTIKNVRVGYETYGTLNAAGDNGHLQIVRPCSFDHVRYFAACCLEIGQSNFIAQGCRLYTASPQLRVNEV